jgi:type I restriction enzyme M protein
VRLPIAARRLQAEPIRRVILPFALRRLECVLQGSKPAVLAEATKVEKMAIAEEAEKS